MTDLKLEPGGYLQWDEADWGGTQLKSPNSQISHAALEDLTSRMHEFLLASNNSTFRYCIPAEPKFDS